ncbi:hypothetical protein JBE38_18285 [Pseudomonas sp. ICBG1301]|uniref:hypothetical protein n=1 Tax=Pseudomonas sp. ICBG1301 TaxID=2795987 RepID=UPI0019640923|nr:hypothetical protein [Pseudomonas sp. ICBG1301]MBM9487881.1 hypothetical protein [Pseudomonas sp. ICBG1301]
MSSKPHEPAIKSESPLEDWEDPPNNPSLQPAPLIPGLLPAIVGDTHRNIVTRTMRLEGIQLHVAPWSRGFVELFEVLTVFVNDWRVFIESFATADVLPDPVILDIGPKSLLQTHGLKDIRVHVRNASGNDINYNLIRIYVDAQDPNYGAQPARVQLENYGSELTPAFLVGKTGLGFTIPTPADRRGGDTYSVYVGTSDSPIEDAVPPTGDITGIIPTAVILEKPGEIEVTYNLTDRAFNTTNLSLPSYVRVSLNEPPVFGLISVLEGPLVDKEEARNGVTIRLQGLTGHLPSDRLVVMWEGAEVYNQPIGMGTFPLDIPVGFAPIAAPGEFYEANIALVIYRLDGSTYPAPIVQTQADLREPGVSNPGEGPVDPAITAPTLIGGGPLPSPPNRLSEKDRGFDATVSFPLPTGLVSGDHVDFVYAGNVVATYPVTGSEGAGFLVPFTIAWADIDAVGNGTIDTYCIIRNAVNYKHSVHQDVIVEIFNLSGLGLAIFDKAQTITGNPNFSYFINCGHVPWESVPIRILDPAILQMDDKITVEAVRYAFATPVGMPVGNPIVSPEFTLTSSDVNNGLIVPMHLNAWFEDFTGTQARGYIGIRWKLLRPSTGDRGQSDEVRAAWDLLSTGSPPTCVPGATRRGTL